MTLGGRFPCPTTARTCRRALLVMLVLLGTAGCAAVTQPAGSRVFSTPKYGSDRFIRVQEHTLHYVEAGEGPPLLLIPGAFTTYRAWNRVLPELSSHARVFAVDYLGVGDSDKPARGFRYTVEEQADVLAGMIVALGLSRVDVMGASYGGAVALNLAVRYPELVRKVVCIEGGALITPEALNYSKLGSLIEWPILGEIIWGFMKSGWFDRMTARSVMGRAWDELTPEERDEITGIFSANIMTVSRPAWINLYRVITSRIDFIESLERAEVPVLYLYGEDSKYRAVAEMNARRFAERTPAIEVVPFRGGVHDLHLQYPREVARIALRFLGAGPGVVAGRVAAPEAGPHAQLERTNP